MMSPYTSPLAFLLLLSSVTPQSHDNAATVALEALSLARNRASAAIAAFKDDASVPLQAWADCLQLYDYAAGRVRRLITGAGYGSDDARTLLSAASTAHRTCITGLREAGGLTAHAEREGVEVARRLEDALAAVPMSENLFNSTAKREVFRRWQGSVSKADVVVAQDGSGDFKTINAAVALLNRRKEGGRRVVIHVKAGVYRENVLIGGWLRNLVFVGDGIDKTIVTSNRSFHDGHTTIRSATFGVWADGFWAKDMTFENTAGAARQQAVALLAASDQAIFHRCSFKGYQDTLFTHSLRQFYRDCEIHGTVDFIFGNAAAVIQNCDLFIRTPLPRQANTVTAQGRDSPLQNTGISIHASRVRPSPEFEKVKDRFESYLGRPWRSYSRTVVMKTELGGMISSEGWKAWEGGFAPDTLYYAEYLNTGKGAATARRVKWRGFHLIADDREATTYSVENFIQGRAWIPESGVPFWPGV
ncbi:hypothetical protein HPP92_025173 [Vanilla planifolia]|uniref:Pectinesterase n=1 Tax=Vanilla planifolia TaxID=51239 RepID=A0A835PLE4_VANPL|nr:hypothetical protein HPP92_025173 [Vanilla planifolia]